MLPQPFDIAKIYPWDPPFLIDFFHCVWYNDQKAKEGRCS